MSKFKKARFPILLFFTVLLGLYIVLPRLGLFSPRRSVSSYMHHLSVLPRIERTMAIRFDPSFHYKGIRPRKMAKQLATLWKSAGINLVYYRAYDPAYGAFYRTRYKFNKEEEFGRYDLLRYILNECQARNIRVFAWLPVLNHKGAWQANPAWRSKNAQGTDFSDSGLEFPLCARRDEVQEWWSGFLRDLLGRYPQIDGIDFAEPVISWRKGDACYCELCTRELSESGPEEDFYAFRAQPLSTLLKKSTDLVHSAGKKVSVTFVVTAYPSGEIYSLEEMRELTGFDLDSLLPADTGEVPDIICPEFIWQEWQSKYFPDQSSSSPFTPQWTEHAFRSFSHQIDSPVEVVAHVEITDFPGVEVDGEALRAAIKAAIEGGATGIDIYSSSQIDKKEAWSALEEINQFVKRKKCLILHDQESNLVDAIQTSELLRHFHTEVTIRSIEEYHPGLMSEFDNVFYAGTEWGSEIPSSLVEDLLHLRTSFCWLGFNLNAALSNEELSAKLGIEYHTTVKNGYNRVKYKGMTLEKIDPWTNVVRILDREKCRVLATATNGEEEIPYALRCGRYFWFFADVPSSYMVEADRSLVFADLLHDILDENHARKHLAMVRIEDVHPLTDPVTLKKIANYLRSQDVPFLVSLLPWYVHPEKNIHISLSERPDFVSALKHMVRKGGVLVMHGVTHQRFGESTTDYEFWDPVSDSPVKGQTELQIRQRVEEGLKECWVNDIYPLMWETPHYAGSQTFYSVISDIFSTSIERRQSIDKKGTDQIFPYAILPDRFGQIVLPENLGYVPLDNPHPEVIIEPAKKMKAVRDGVASFFFHPFVDIAVLKDIVSSLKKEKFSFASASHLPLRVETSFGTVQNTPGSVHLTPKSINGQEISLIFPGMVSSKKKATVDSSGEFKKKVSLKGGEMYAAHFIAPYELARRKIREREKKEITGDIEKLMKVNNYQGEPCLVPLPLLMVNSNAEENLKDEAESFERTFAAVGIALEKMDVAEFEQVPAGINLLIIPQASASMLQDHQVGLVMKAVREEGLSLITSGFTPLSEELEIARRPGQVEVQTIEDTYFPEAKIRWEKAVSIPSYECDQKAEFLYKDKNTNFPLVISSSQDEGMYIFLAPLDGENNGEISRYPFLLWHVFRCLNFFPLVRRASAEVFFNPAEREDVAIEDLVKSWRRSGVRTVYAAGWHIFPEWSYDYERLIRLAHANGILVYAWFEPPFVHEKFWLDFPQWREKNAHGEDAVIGWRKPMALADPEVLKAVLEEWETFLQSYLWDGVVLNRLGFESGSGPSHPESHTPFHPSVRRQFEKEKGFDPVELFDPRSTNHWRANSEAIQEFKNFRSELASRYVESILEMLCRINESKQSSLEIIITYDTRHPDSGIELGRLLDWKRHYGARLQLIPERENQWELPAEEFDLIQISISPTPGDSSFHPSAPTSYPTGSALYNLLAAFIHDSRRFTLFSENSLYEIDTWMLPFVLASHISEKWSEEALFISAPHTGEMAFSDKNLENIIIDDRTAGSFYQNRLLFPAGEHKIIAAARENDFKLNLKSNTRLVDFSGDILECVVDTRGIKFRYRGERRILALVNHEPIVSYLNGEKKSVHMEECPAGWVILFPEGEHSVTLVTRSFLDLALKTISLSLSNAIVVISITALALFLFIFVFSRVRTDILSQRE